MKRIKNSFFFALLFLSACRSLNPSDQSDLPIIKFDSITLGQSTQEVEKILGPAKRSYFLTRKDNTKDELWVYDHSQSGDQRAAVQFASDTHRIKSKTLIPMENEFEKKLDFVLKTKFQKFDFRKASRTHCSHFTTPTELYYNLDKGISFIFDVRDQEVTGITWSTFANLKEEVLNFESCKKNTSQIIEIRK